MRAPEVRPEMRGTEVLVALGSPSGISVIAATVLSSMVCFLDANVVNVAVPAIGRDLSASVAGLQWTLTGYLLTVASLLLVTGTLADRFGRRRLLVTGMLVMLAASVLCAIAPSIGVLIAARVVQGGGAALVVPSSLALLNGTLRTSDRARGIGIWAGLATLGSTVGPYAGGWLVDHASWRWVFLLNIPLILAALAALRRVPDSDVDRRRLSLDGFGAVLAVIGLGGVIYAVTSGSTHGWLSGPVLVAAGLGVMALVTLVPVERRRPAPMLRLSLFASRQFDAINVATVLLYGALGAAAYLLVLECELELGYSAAQAGAVLIPESIVFLAVSPISGTLVSRIGPRWMMFSGMIVVAGAFFWLSRAGSASGYTESILPSVLLWGLGIGLTVTPLTASVLAAVGDIDLGEASAVNDSASRLGGVITIASVPALIGVSGGHNLTHALAHGYRPAMIALSGISVAAAIVTAVYVSDEGAVAPRIVPSPRCHGCALPTPDASELVPTQ